VLCAAAAAMSLAAASDAPAAGEDPWPLWQRTANRLGNTQTIGPRTPNIVWSAPFTTEATGSLPNGNLVIDRFGHLVAGSPQGLAVLDPVSHEIVWEQLFGDSSGRIGISDGRVVMGRGNPNGIVFCFEIATGEEHWSRDTGGGYNAAPVFHDGVVYISNNGGHEVLALQLEDGELIWSAPTDDSIYDSPSLDWPQLLTSAGTPDASGFIGLEPATGAVQWTFDTSREVFGTPVIHEGTVYVASTDRWLYAIDQDTGEELWRFWCEQANRGSVALAHDDTIYTATTGNIGLLFAVSPAGEQRWRRELPGLVGHPPVVDGEDRVYVTSIEFVADESRVQAFLRNGEEQWSMVMPDDCRASPTLGPDGTLYILCRDKNVYAFRDPHERMGIDNLEITTGTVLSGGVAELAEPDDEHLVVRSGFGRRLSELHKMELIVRGEVETVQPHVLRLQLQSRISEPSGVATVRLRNWDTGAFETVAAYPLSEDEPFEWIQIPEGGNAEYIDPSRYIHPFGQVELQLTHVVFAPFLAFQFDSFIDQIKIEAAE